MTSDLFVTGTDTGAGKTLLSALLVSALNRKYWKPIQTGMSEGTDRETVMRWAEVGEDRTYPEAYRFDPPVSPHLAAERQGTTIEMAGIRRPASNEGLIIEGAGGVFVPINNDSFMLDLMKQLGAPAIIASRTALGTINHTLLTVVGLREGGVDVRGVVMIGDENVDNRRAIERYGNVPVIGAIPWLNKIDRSMLQSVFVAHFDAKAFQ